MGHEQEARRGRIVRGVGGLYTARDAQGAEYVLRARGRFRREGVTPLVGDAVCFTPGQGEEHGWLDEILPRLSRSVRPPAANITLMVIVVAPVPQPDLLLADRLLVHAGRSGFGALLCVNKSDLDETLQGEIGAQYRRTDVPVLGVSARTGEGMEALRARMRGGLCCMAGQSAVGKSTLLNALLGLELKTGGVSLRTQRGKHTTRHTELIEAGGIAVLDTPGFSLLALDADMEPETLPDLYPEYARLSPGCRFQPCLHDTEPDCAVRAAVDAGELDASRHARYRTLLFQVRETWNGRYRK